MCEIPFGAVIRLERLDKFSRKIRLSVVLCESPSDQSRQAHHVIECTNSFYTCLVYQISKCFSALFITRAAVRLPIARVLRSQDGCMMLIEQPLDTQKLVLRLKAIIGVLDRLQFIGGERPTGVLKLTMMVKEFA